MLSMQTRQHTHRLVSVEAMKNSLNNKYFPKLVPYKTKSGQKFPATD